jgi:hypothetical protein
MRCSMLLAMLSGCVIGVVQTRPHSVQVQVTQPSLNTGLPVFLVQLMQ